MSRLLSMFALAALLVGGILALQRISQASNTAVGVSTDDVAATDQELIDKQKVCPVTDRKLGSMGAPIKVMVKDRAVFICCAGCKKALLADPDKYLKKLDNPQPGKK